MIMLCRILVLPRHFLSIFLHNRKQEPCISVEYMFGNPKSAWKVSFFIFKLKENNVSSSLKVFYYYYYYYFLFSLKKSGPLICFVCRELEI